MAVKVTVHDTHWGREREIIHELPLSNNRAQKDKQQTILGGNCKHRLKESCLTFWQDDNESSSIKEYLAAPPVDNGWPCYHCAGVRLGLLWVRNEVKRSCNACRAFEMPPTGEAHRIAARVFFTYQHHDEWVRGGSQSLVQQLHHSWRRFNEPSFFLAFVFTLRQLAGFFVESVRRISYP